MKKLGMFTRYTALGASSRYRFYKYVLELIRDGYDVKVSPFFSDTYLNGLYETGRKRYIELLKSYILRFFSLFKSGRNIIIEYELFPGIPYFIERLFLRRKRYILNFDDNVWEKYSNNSLLRRKYDKLCRHATGIIVANDFLKKRVRKLNDNVIKIPTALDPEPYQYGTAKREKFSLIWIGTPVTYKYIKAFSSVFQHLARKIDYELIIIAKNELKKDPIEGVNMTFLNWSQDLETFFLPKAHIGIMPLTSDNFSRGKSSFKIFQYFASGIPAIASPVGENKKVIKDGVNGFLVDSEEEWVNRVLEIYKDSDLRQKMGDAALESAEEYSLNYWTPEFIKFVERSLKR